MSEEIPYERATVGVTKVKKFSPKITKLLDAAFQTLQHDTGESNEEWRFTRNHLGAKFAEILKSKRKVIKL